MSSDILLQDYDLDDYLDDGRKFVKSKWILYRPAGDTLDEIIMKLIGETPIRNRV